MAVIRPECPGRRFNNILCITTAREEDAHIYQKFSGTEIV
jgi:hypothetical protein